MVPDNMVDVFRYSVLLLILVFDVYHVMSWMFSNFSSMNSIIKTYSYFMDEVSDPRSKDWLLISSPWHTILLMVAYWLVVYFGRKIMANRKPFELKGAMIVYNLLLVTLSAYMVKELLISAWLNPKFSLNCADVDRSDDALSLRLAKVLWWYFFSKPLEFADTIFFVLRKKTTQVTFLHVYHHSTMPLLWWLGVRFAPGGEAFFAATMNSFVHVIMYGYYLLAAMGPRVQPYLWWKKYLTSLQLVQFFVVLSKVVYTLYIDCPYPQGFQQALVLYMLSLIVLFSNFFYQTYHVRISAKLHGTKSKKPVVAENNQDNNDTASVSLGGVSYRQRSVRKED